MGEVIEYEDFYTLRMIRNSIKEQTKRHIDGQGDFEIAIAGEKKLFKNYLSRLAEAG